MLMDIGKWSIGIWPSWEEGDGHWLTWGEWVIGGARIYGFIKIGRVLIKRFG